MDNITKVEHFMEKGFNCAQSVFMSFSEEMGISQETAAKITSGLGGGMGRMGEACGAFNGGAMALGMIYGSAESQDEEEKTRIYSIIGEFALEFERKNGGLRCNDIIGYNMRVPEQRSEAKEKGIFQAKCSECMKSAVSIVTEIIRRSE